MRGGKETGRGEGGEEKERERGGREGRREGEWYGVAPNFSC